VLPRMLYLDFETTGLNPHVHKLLEVGAILVGPDLKPLFQFTALVQYTSVELENIDNLMEPVVKKMHTRNGLLEALAEYQQPTMPFQDIDEKLAEHLHEHGINKNHPVLLAGSSPGAFDAAWADVWLKETCDCLFRRGHRVYDLSTLRTHYELQSTDNHRALADCQRDLELARRLYVDREQILTAVRGLQEIENDLTSYAAVDYTVDLLKRIWNIP